VAEQPRGGGHSRGEYGRAGGHEADDELPDSEVIRALLFLAVDHEVVDPGELFAQVDFDGGWRIDARHARNVSSCLQNGKTEKEGFVPRSVARIVAPKLSGASTGR
jgi:hypothetical protein